MQLCKRCLFKIKTAAVFQASFSTSSQYFNVKKRGVPVKEKEELPEEDWFVDWRRVNVIGGSGGNGCVALRKELYNVHGRPDGGNGGHGGHVIFRSGNGLNSLGSVATLYKGKDGERGKGGNRDGKNGKHKVIQVPLGTIFKDENGNILADLAAEQDMFIASRGGAGGKGNTYFVCNENRSPMVGTKGSMGQDRTLELELRTIAHAGLVGFPNVGKSSLLRAISRARPKVAAYPFTTLNPHVGMVQYQDYEQVAVADIPGLVRGAHLNRGLGHSFLRHITRCSCLLYVLDLSADRPWTQLDHLMHELEQYQPGLAARPHALVANKVDLPQSRANLPLLERHTRLPVIPVSALHRTNMEELRRHLRQLYDRFAVHGRPQRPRRERTTVPQVI